MIYIPQKVEKESEDYEKYIEDMKSYNQFQKLMKNENHISDEMLLEFFMGLGSRNQNINGTVKSL